MSKLGEYIFASCKYRSFTDLRHVNDPRSCSSLGGSLDRILDQLVTSFVLVPYLVTIADLCRQLSVFQQVNSPGKAIRS